MNLFLLSKCIGAVSDTIVRILDASIPSHKSRVASATVSAHRSVSLSIDEEKASSHSSLPQAASTGVLLTLLFAVLTIYVGVRLTHTVLAGHRLVSAEPALRKLHLELLERRRDAVTDRLPSSAENAAHFAGSAEETEKILGQLRSEFNSDPDGQALYARFALNWDQLDLLAEANRHAMTLQVGALNALRQHTISASGFLQPSAVEMYGVRNPPTLTRRVSAASRIDANIRELRHLTEELAVTQLANPEATPGQNAATAKVRDYISCIHQLGRGFRTLIFAQNEAMAGNWEHCWRQAAAASEEVIRVGETRGELFRRLNLALETTDHLIAGQLEPHRLTRLDENARSVRQTLAWLGALFVIWVSTLLNTNYLRGKWQYCFLQLRAARK